MATWWPPRPPVVLASSSPRRSVLLVGAGLPVEVVMAPVDEHPTDVAGNATAKLAAVVGCVPPDRYAVVAADTVVRAARPHARQAP